MICGIILILLVVSLMRSNGETRSFIGVVRCDANDWGLFALLQWCCAIFAVIAVRIIVNDHKKK